MSSGMRSEQAWERAYDEAMQWRDWQSCDQLLEERDQSDWYRGPVHGRWWHRVFRLLLRVAPDA